MKALLQTKFKELNNRYEVMPSSRKRLILVVIFVLSLLWILDVVLFQSLDKHKLAKENFEQLLSKKEETLKEKQALLLKNAYSSEKGLLKKKADLLADIDRLLRTNNNSNYIASEDVSKLIEKVVGNVTSTKVLLFKNLPNLVVPTEPNSSVLVKHSFNLKVEGSFQGIYELLISLENLKGINISTVDIVKEDNGEIIASFEFYVLNTNNNVLNF